MKKTIVLLLCAALIFGQAGCSLRDSAAGRTGSASPSVSDVLAAGMAADGNTAEDSLQTGEARSENSAEPVPAAATDQVDVDLTKMSATMVYSEVYNMLSLPDNYLGKTVRMNGQFQVYPGDGRNYYVVIIADATACCQQGMEFVLAGDPAYPDGYPEPGRDVTVTDVFDTYYEGEYMRYCQLIDAYITN